MLLQFLNPYLTLCHLASWGLAQNLEGLGLFKYLSTAPMQVGDAIVYPLNLDPKMGVAHLAVIVTGVLVVVFLVNVRASFYLNKWVGLASLVLWSLPGFFNIFGCMPNIIGMGPDVFRFNDGFPGSMESAAANLFICLIGGWSIILLFSSLWKKNTFKNAYDHLWYTIGLVAALYFVVDAGLPSYKEDLAEVDDRMVRTLQLFRSAEERLEVLCGLPEVARLSPALCAQAPALKWGLLNYLDMDGKVRAKVQPPGRVAELASDPVLAHQIDALNHWACVLNHQPAQCRKVPFDTALSSQDVDKALVFPPSNYAKAIQKFHASMKKSDQRIHEIERGHNLRYFGFLLVAILAGGKLANASRAMVKEDSVRPPSWMLIVIKYCSKKTMALLQRLGLSILVFGYFVHYVAVLLASYQETRAVDLEQRRMGASAQKKAYG